MRALLEVHAPAKVANIAGLLEKHRGREEQLLARVRAKYADAEPGTLHPGVAVPIASTICADDNDDSDNDDGDDDFAFVGASPAARADVTTQFSDDDDDDCDM